MGDGKHTRSSEPAQHCISRALGSVWSTGGVGRWGGGGGGDDGVRCHGQGGGGMR